MPIEIVREETTDLPQVGDVVRLRDGRDYLVVAPPPRYSEWYQVFDLVDRTLTSAFGPFRVMGATLTIREPGVVSEDD